jgi:hypothetical protein
MLRLLDALDRALANRIAHLIASWPTAETLVVLSELTCPYGSAAMSLR